MMGEPYPVRVLAVQAGEVALVEVEDHLQEVALSGLRDPVVIAGDWLLVKAGVALIRIDAEEASRLRGR